MLSKMLFAVIVCSLVQSSSANEANEKQEIERAKATAQLKLLDKDRASKAEAKSCCDGLAEGRKKSSDTGKPLILWVGMECKEIPDLHDDLKDAVHAHVKEFNGNKDSGVIVPTANGDYHFPKEKLKNGTFTAKSILDILGKKTSKIKLQTQYVEFCPPGSTT